MSKRRSSLWERFPPRSQRHDGTDESRHHRFAEHGTDLMQNIMRITAVLDVAGIVSIDPARRRRKGTGQCSNNP